MSTSWKVKNKEERGGKGGEKKQQQQKQKKHTIKRLKFIIIVKWNKINDRMIEIK